jgi:hypothetical protein
MIAVRFGGDLRMENGKFEMEKADGLGGDLCEGELENWGDGELRN